MQVRCIRPFAGHKVGDLVEVPDGAEVSPVYFEPASDSGPPEAPPETGSPDTAGRKIGQMLAAGIADSAKGES